MVPAAEAVRKLTAHSWPGNIRELKNVVHYVLLTASGASITAEELRIAAPAETPAAFPARSEHASPAICTSRISEALRECFQAPGGRLLRDVERRLVEDAFEYCDSNQVRTAELLGVSRNVVRTLLKRYGLISHLGDVDGGISSTGPLAISYCGEPQNQHEW